MFTVMLVSVLHGSWRSIHVEIVSLSAVGEEWFFAFRHSFCLPSFFFLRFSGVFFFLLCVLCYSCLCTCVFVVVWSCLRQWHESWKDTKRTSLHVPADTATSTSGWPFIWVNSWVVRGTVDRNARNCLLELSARQLPLGMSLWTVLGMSGM